MVVIILCYYHLLLLLAHFTHVSFGIRRIIDGKEVTDNKAYAVYFVKAPKSEALYKGWTCAGAIVTQWFIVTSASCLAGVKYMYAIAGYHKFVNDKDVDIDECTKAKKKKIILTCVPRDYGYGYNNYEWTRGDIGLAKVESPYDFEDTSYADLCSYTPAPILINYDPRYQQPGLDAMVMGWGHTGAWRKVKDIHSYNSETLRYASTRILNKTVCKNYYKIAKGMDKIIDDNMICTLYEGNLDDMGHIIMKTKPNATGCLSIMEKMMGREGPLCKLTSQEIIALREEIAADEAALRAKGNRSEEDSLRREEDGHRLEVPQELQYSKKTVENNPQAKPGLCQNDHGGPLVSWVGSNEVLLGVGSAFMLDGNLRCVGPYLFTSTQCKGRFLDCVINMYTDDPDFRRKCNERLKNQGIEVIERRLSWADHPSGPAMNEVFYGRPQQPLHQLALQ